MDKLTDYIRWMGDFPIRATGFRDADALVLCMLAYFDLSPVFPAPGTCAHVRDCLPMAEAGTARVLIVGKDMGYTEILRCAASSVRFGSLEMTDYADVLEQEPPVQFSAVTFRDETGFAFVAYRGTDSSITGWKEDFMISFTRTRAQELALDYARTAVQGAGSWMLGGHSKGGNEALYAACLMPPDLLSRAAAVYLLDSPGLCPEVEGGNLDEPVKSLLVRIVPESSIVGRLFEPDVKNTRIIRSSALGLLQHSPATWGIDHGQLARAQGHDLLSDWVHAAGERWIRQVPLADRTLFVNDLFGALEASGAKTLDELPEAIPGKLDAIRARLQKTSPLTRKILADLPRQAFLATLRTS